MIAGMPGTGIGGLLYLLIAVWMPIRELYFLVRKQTNPKRWRMVRGHIFLTGYLIIGMWATGEIIGRLLLHLGVINAHSTQGISHNILRISPFFYTLATLTLVYLVVHVIRFYVSNADKKRKECDNLNPASSSK